MFVIQSAARGTELKLSIRLSTCCANNKSSEYSISYKQSQPLPTASAYKMSAELASSRFICSIIDHRFNSKIRFVTSLQVKSSKSTPAIKTATLFPGWRPFDCNLVCYLGNDSALRYRLPSRCGSINARPHRRRFPAWRGRGARSGSQGKPRRHARRSQDQQIPLPSRRACRSPCQ